MAYNGKENVDYYRVGTVPKYQLVIRSNRPLPPKNTVITLEGITEGWIPSGAGFDSSSDLGTCVLLNIGSYNDAAPASLEHPRLGRRVTIKVKITGKTPGTMSIDVPLDPDPEGSTLDNLGREYYSLLNCPSKYRSRH